MSEFEFKPCPDCGANIISVRRIRLFRHLFLKRVVAIVCEGTNRQQHPAPNWLGIPISQGCGYFLFGKNRQEARRLWNGEVK